MFDRPEVLSGANQTYSELRALRVLAERYVSITKTTLLWLADEFQKKF